MEKLNFIIMYLMLLWTTLHGPRPEKPGGGGGGGGGL